MVLTRTPGNWLEGLTLQVDGFHICTCRALQPNAIVCLVRVSDLCGSESRSVKLEWQQTEKCCHYAGIHSSHQQRLSFIHGVQNLHGCVGQPCHNHSPLRQKQSTWNLTGANETWELEKANHELANPWKKNQLSCVVSFTLQQGVAVHVAQLEMRLAVTRMETHAARA